MSPPPLDMVRLARKALWSLQASITTTREVEIYRGGTVRIVLPGGARFGVALDTFGVTLSCQPGILAMVAYRPDVRIHQLRYTFASGGFRVEAEGDRTNLFGLVGSITANKIEYRLHERFGPLLPYAMRQPGYTPAADEALLDNLRSLVDVLASSVTRTRGEVRLADVRPGLGEDLHLYLHAVSPDHIRVALGLMPLEVLCPLGTSIFVSVQTEGPLDRPRIRSLKLGSTPPGVVIRSVGQPGSAAFKLDLREVHLRPGGRVRVRYDLGVDDTWSLPPGLRSFLGLANVRFHRGSPGAAVANIRRALDAVLEREIPAHLERHILKLAPLLPGVHLPDLFGFGASRTGNG